MISLKRQLPSVNGLLTFEAAARHLGFTRAAQELYVSQAAVSRQIRRLEEQLGTPLFQRQHRALKLTDAGRRLHEAVTMGLSHIAAVIQDISEAERPAQIQVATTVAFATYWLLPRLNAFRERHPEADVRVLASDRYQDHLADEVDIALTCGIHDVPGWHTDRLFEEIVFPVCSPDYLAAHPVGELRDLADHTLLNLDPGHWENIGWEPVDWPLWLKQFGAVCRSRTPTVTFNNYPMLVEAAMAGEGIALGWRHLSETLVRQRRLVRPVDEEWSSGRSYYLAIREQPPPSPGSDALRDWLLAERRAQAEA